MKKQFGRILLVWAVFLTGSFGLGARIYWLQLRDGGRWDLAARATSQHQTAVRPYRPRRTILDRRGYVLAGDRLAYTLYVHPKIFAAGSNGGHTQAEVAEFLAELLPDRSSEALLARFRQQETGIRLADDLTEAEAERIRKGIERIGNDGEPFYEAIAGLDLESHYSRYYPRQELAASVIGYVRRGEEHQGQAGIELYADGLLARETSSLLRLHALRSGTGKLLPQFLPTAFRDLDERSLQLTLDTRLQRVSQAALARQIQTFDAKRGAVIVMDVRTGAIRSLVSWPSYDPNQYFQAFDLDRFERDPELNPFANWAISDLYEPGSTFKPINLAIALDAGVISPHIKIHDPGKIRVGGWTIRNHNYDQRGGNGTIDLAEILQVSSNIGMIRVMEHLDPTQYHDKLLALGLQEKTGIDLPGEMAGRLKGEAEFRDYPIEPAVTSFGQGFSLTPLKLVQLHAAIANGGKLVTPHTIAGWVDAEGQLIERPPLPEPRQVLSPEATHHVLSMMETVVTDGSGKSARIRGYRLAGKTGTAQKALRNRRGYGNGKITSFVGLMPVEDPRYVVAAVVDEPTRGQPYGSTVAAPIVKEVMEMLIAIEGLPPAPIPETTARR